MAFMKQIDIRGTGHVDEYWRITNVNFDMVDGFVLVMVQGYKDESVRRAGMNPHARIEYRFTQADVAFPLHSATLALLYGAVKADASKPFFVDAVDVLDVALEDSPG